jgi:hypothetical protein
MRAAAELPRDVLDLHHPNALAVLLAEQRHRAEALGLVACRLDRAHRMVRREPPGHEPLDLGKVVGRQALAVREVEAQLVGAYVRAGLAHVRAEALAERRVQQVGGRVVAHRREPPVALHDRAHGLALPQLALDRLECERLVVAHAVHVHDPRAAGRRLHQSAV